MNKSTYLKILKKNLKSMSLTERKECINDIEEHFIVGLQNGKTEEEMIEELGSPEEVAKSYLVEQQENAPYFQEKTNKKASGWTRMFLAAIGVLFLNVVFIIGPICAVLALYVGLCATAVGCIVSPLGIFYQLFFYDAQNILFILFSSIALCGAGILMAIILYKIGKWIASALVKYVKFNIQVVVGG